MKETSGERRTNETSNNKPAKPRHEGDTGLEKDENPAGEKSRTKRGRPAGSKNAKKPCSQIENRNVDGPAHFCSAHITVEGRGGGGQEEAMKGLQMQVDKLQGLLTAKRAYDAAIVSINKCVDAGALTSGEAEAQRAEADAALNAAKEAAGVAATRTEIDAQEGEEKENQAGKRGRPAGSKNVSKTRIDDLSDATLAAVCSDLDLAPAVGSESSVREQRMRGINAASGSTAKMLKTSLDRLSVATLKFICTDRKLLTSGDDMDRQIYMDRILAGLPGKKSSQLQNRNVGGHTASVDLKVEGGGGGQEATMLPLSSCSIDKDRDQMPLKCMSAGKQPEKNNITAADHTLHETKSEESQKGKQITVRQTKRARTTMQATTTELTANVLSPFTAVLAAVPAESWSRTWPAERTIMLRMTSKSVKNIVGKLRPPAFVRWKMSFLDDKLNGTATKNKTLVVRQLTALSLQCRITTLELFFDDNTSGWSHPCRIKGQVVERIAGVLAKCPALAHLNLSCNGIETEGAESLAGVLAKCTVLAHLDLSYNHFFSAGAESLAGVLAQCPVLAHLNLSTNRIRDAGAESLAGVLAQCRVLAYLNLSSNRIGADGAGKLAGVLGQCRALAHLDLGHNVLGADGAGKLAGVLGQCRALTHLDLYDNRIEAAGVESLAGVLAKCPALAHLNLSSNHFGAAGASSLAGVLAQCRALAHLNLNRNDFGDAGAESLARVLPQCSTLSHLDLGYNGIGAPGAGSFAGVLGQCAALAHLNLGDNRLGDAGAVRLARVLSQCAALAHLDLRWNDIGDEGAERLAVVLAQCQALAHLELRCNQIGPDGAECFAGVLGQCTTLAHLDLSYQRCV